MKGTHKTAVIFHNCRKGRQEKGREAHQSYAPSWAANDEIVGQNG